MCFPDLSVTNDPQMNKNYNFIDNRVKKQTNKHKKQQRINFQQKVIYPSHLEASIFNLQWWNTVKKNFTGMEQHCKLTLLCLLCHVFLTGVIYNSIVVFQFSLKSLAERLNCFFFFHGTYLQIILPLDLLWQGLICSEQAIAFHISGWHLLISRTGIFINGILILPFSQSFMSFMAPWSDCELQLLKSSVGLKRKS